MAGVVPPSSTFSCATVHGPSSSYSVRRFASFLTSTFLTFSYHPATLCINAGFYLGAGNSSIASIAYPWLLSIESFAGARVVLNLHAVSFDVSTDGFGTSGRGGGTLSSHIVFTTHSSVENRPRTPSVRWDWGGLQEYPRDDRTGRADRSRSDTGTGPASESYEMTWTMSAGSSGRHKHTRHKASTSATNPTSPDTCSDTCVDVEQDEV